MKEALLVFARIPEPGNVKTRLTTLLTDDEAARLYEAFLHDALKQYQDLGVAVRLYLSPPAGNPDRKLAELVTSVHMQQGKELGERMQHAFLESFLAGYQRLVIVGTDHPTLPTAFVEQAFEALAEPLSICLGPSEDGGYYLLGMNDLYPQLFQDMTYSHADVFQQTLERALTTNAALTVLPSWYDVDTPEDLYRLAAELDGNERIAPQTRAVIHALRNTYPVLTPSASSGG